MHANGTIVTGPVSIINQTMLIIGGQIVKWKLDTNSFTNLGGGNNRVVELTGDRVNCIKQSVNNLPDGFY